MGELSIVRLLYSKGELKVRVPKKNLIGVIEPHDLPGVSSPLKEVQRAVLNPIRSQRLRSFVKRG